MSIFQNTCKPKGLGGKLMIKSMNSGHSQLHKWGITHIEIPQSGSIIDIGCGGGTNLKRFLDASKDARVYGIDYSELSAAKSSQLCKKEIKAGRCLVQVMDVLDITLPINTFSLATAFETIYFWKDLNKAFTNIHKILKEDGKFLICNETNGRDSSQDKWVKIIDGMKIYSIDEIKESLLKAGFKKVEVDDSYKTWLTIIATK